MERWPVRILEALTSGGLGGTETSLLGLLKHLDRGAFECEVSVLDGGGPVADRLRGMGVPVHDLRRGAGYAGAARRFRRLVADRRYDIVHLYGFRMGLMGRILVSRTRPRPRVVQGIRGLHLTESDEVTNWKARLALLVERATSSLVDAYIANSQGAADFLTRRGLAASKFTVIPNGVELQDTLAARSPSEHLEIVCVAHFRPGKRHGDLIEALALLRERGAAARCVLIGEGVRRSRVEALVRERRLDGSVEFAGLRSPEQVRQALSLAGVFVLPSASEGSPMSVLEAMAAGLPVVATDVPGTREVVVPGSTGILVPPEDPAALADALERLHGDPALRAGMGDAARARAERRFSIAQAVERHAAAYAALAGGEGGKPGHA
jgi:glycosyltransferase involved in cell wall biosynthesis